MGMGDEGPAQAGGVSLFSRQLEQYRWVAQNESHSVAGAGYNIEDWPTLRFSYELEDALAWGHEATRSRLALWGTAQLVGGDELHSRASSVVDALDSLEQADDDLLFAADHWQSAREEVVLDPLEMTRYNRLNDSRHHMIRLLVAGVLIVTEWFMTGFVFDKALPVSGIPYAGYYISLGALTILIGLPHMVAKGLKQGLTRHHAWDAEGNPNEIPSSKKRQIDSERVDDRVFVAVSIALLMLTFGTVLCLAVLRASDVQGSNKWIWFFLYLFLQLVISGFFFLTEWLDYGAASHGLAMADRRLTEARDFRKSSYQYYVGSLASYFAYADFVFKTIADLAQHDNLIVSTFRETLHWGRHQQTMQAGGSEAFFIHAATTPVLGPTDAASNSPLYSIYDEHEWLEDDAPRGRSWILDDFKVALEEARVSSRPGGDPSNPDGNERSAAGHLIDSLSRAWLNDYLWEYFEARLYDAPSAIHDLFPPAAEGLDGNDQRVSTNTTWIKRRPSRDLEIPSEAADGS